MIKTIARTIIMIATLDNPSASVGGLIGSGGVKPLAKIFAPSVCS